jgi:hypothetical protein
VAIYENAFPAHENDGSQNIHSPEMTKPPEGGLPPQEHLT